MVSSDLATYKSPLAIVTLLLYQQPSSTTLYYSYQECLFLTKARLRNETREITCVSASLLMYQQPSSTIKCCSLPTGKLSRGADSSQTTED